MLENEQTAEEKTAKKRAKRLKKKNKRMKKINEGNNEGQVKSFSEKCDSESEQSECQVNETESD